MSVIQFFSVLFIAMVLVYPAQAVDQKETVVILHGIAKTSNSMRPVELALQKNGYETLSITYPSTDKNLDGIATYLRKKYLTKEFWQNTGKVNVVTHSMGGLVIRRYFDVYKNDIIKDKLGRVVMLAPPNGGSEVSDLIHNLPLYKWYYGSAGDELTTDAQSKNKSDIYYELGIIAGTKEWPYFVAAFITPGKSDGRVTVEKTKLEGMKDHVSVNGTHTFIMDKPNVHKYILQFLKNGEFEHEK
ncbi:MAG: alpha/beta hydrolase [Alphaproteobacteria bacterium]|nr:alpha/beta hydrolase [Alphaproteobacteria bacterium]